jgi:hypothetical protein
MKDLKNKCVLCVLRVQVAHTAHTIKTKLYSITLNSIKETENIAKNERVACVTHASTRHTRLFPYLLYVERFFYRSNFFPHIREKKRSVCCVLVCLDAFLRKIPTFGKVEVAYA